MNSLHKVKVLLPLVIVVLLSALLACSDDDDEKMESQTTSNDSGQQLTDWEKLYAGIEEAVYTTIDSGFQQIKPIFERSCFDCHSQQTHYPWYAKVPVIKGMIEDDITEGRKEVDMTNGFPFKGKGTQSEMLHHIHDEIAKGDMPIFSYRLMHWGTKIEGAQRDSVFGWISISLTRLEHISR